MAEVATDRGCVCGSGSGPGCGGDGRSVGTPRGAGSLSIGVGTGEGLCRWWWSDFWRFDMATDSLNYDRQRVTDENSPLREQREMLLKEGGEEFGLALQSLG